MPRPSRNTDRLLTAAGRALIYQRGFSGLSVREIAKKAKVNLGMFHYHFKTKKAFTQRLLREIYEEFFWKFSLEGGGKGPADDRLRRALNVLGQFVRDNRAIILALIQDVLSGNKETSNFLDENFFRHAAVIKNLVEEGQREGIFRPMPIPRAIAYLASSVAVPNFVITVLERAGAKKLLNFKLKMVKDDMLSDSGISARVDMALRGLSGK